MEFLQISPAQRLQNLYLAQKLDFLWNILWDTRKSFEQMGYRCGNKHMRRTVHALAIENSQYLSELLAQMNSLGAEKDTRYPHSPAFPDPAESLSTMNEQDILKACNRNESRIIRAYREILKEKNLHPAIKELLDHQVRGFINSFLQVKQLYSCLWR